MEPGDILGLVTIAAGLVIYSVARYLPMNTLIGFRLGYTFMSRRLWVKFNREMGLALAGVGLATIALGRIVAGEESLIASYLAMVVLAYILLFYRARKEGELEATLKPPEPGRTYRPLEKLQARPHMALLAALAAIAPLIASMVYGRVTFLTVIYMLPGVMALALVIVASRIPVILYNPWIPPGGMLNVIFEALIIVSMLETISLTPLISQEKLNTITILAATYILARFALIMRKKPDT